MKEKRHLRSKCMGVVLLAVLCSMLFAMTAAAKSKTVSMKFDGGAYTYTGNQNSNVTMYHKIKVKKSGVMLVSAASNVGATARNMRVWLCNSKKKSLERTSKGSSVNAVQFINTGTKGMVCYGVKKGTYYIKTKGAANYMVVAACEPVADKGGSAKSRATWISENTQMMGLLPAGESYKAADWYKFNVNQSRVLYMELEAVGDGQFQYYLYGPSYPNGARITSMMNKSGKYWSTPKGSSATARVKRGTYYIKVARGTSSAYRKSSGAYSLKWYLR